MNNELKDKIAKDLKVSGFASEMKAMNTILNSNWNCSASESYFDLDSEQTREIDLNAALLIRDRISQAQLEYNLCIEVKKSKSPWVIFRKQGREQFSRDSWVNTSYTSGLRFEPSELSILLGDTCLRNYLGWLGHGIHESFKSPNDSSRWYSACVSSLKACYHNTSIYDEIGHPPGDASFLVMNTPVVVVDTVLCTATLDHNGELKIEEIPFGVIDFEFRTAKYNSLSWRIDIVQIDSLPEYLALQRKRAEKIYDKQLALVNES